MSQLNKGMGSSLTSPITREEIFSPIESFLDSFFNDSLSALSTSSGISVYDKYSYPKVDIIQNEKDMLIEAEIPGLSKEDVSVELEKNILTISGVSRKDKSSGKSNYIRREIKRSSFKRSFTISDSLNKEKIKADFKDGILNITIPKNKPDSVKKLKIL